VKTYKSQWTQSWLKPVQINVNDRSAKPKHNVTSKLHLCVYCARNRNFRVKYYLYLELSLFASISYKDELLRRYGNK